MKQMLAAVAAQTVIVSVLVVAVWVDDLKFLALMPILIRLWEL